MQAQKVVHKTKLQKTASLTDGFYLTTCETSLIKVQRKNKRGEDLCLLPTLYPLKIANYVDSVFADFDSFGTALVGFHVTKKGEMVLQKITSVSGLKKMVLSINDTIVSEMIITAPIKSRYCMVSTSSYEEAKQLKDTVEKIILANKKRSK